MKQKTSMICWGLALLLTGCQKSDAPREYSVTGTVTYGQNDLSEGSVLFEDPEQVDRSYSAVIRDGRFSTRMTPGKKLVRITAVRPAPGKTMPSGDGLSQVPAVEQYIPARYNQKTELEVRVEETNENKFEFHLQPD